MLKHFYSVSMMLLLMDPARHKRHQEQPTNQHLHRYSKGPGRRNRHRCFCDDKRNHQRIDH